MFPDSPQCCTCSMTSYSSNPLSFSWHFPTKAPTAFCLHWRSLAQWENNRLHHAVGNPGHYFRFCLYGHHNACRQAFLRSQFFHPLHSHFQAPSFVPAGSSQPRHAHIRSFIFCLLGLANSVPSLLNQVSLDEGCRSNFTFWSTLLSDWHILFHCSTMTLSSFHFFMDTALSPGFEVYIPTVRVFRFLWDHPHGSCLLFLVQILTKEVHYFLTW